MDKDLQKLQELQNEKPLPGTILKGYGSQATAFKVDDYPWGFRLRTSIYYWIESKPGFGDRLCTYTIDPRSGRACKPKCGTYSPFIYMYINEKGHVEHAAIDSYNRELFKDGKFQFIINRIGEGYINDVQQANLRANHFQHVKMSYPYDKAKYSEAMQPEFTEWIKATLKHIATAEFKEICNYPDPPVQDNPDGEIKMTVREYEAPATPVEAATNNITEDKVKEVLEKILPGFVLNAKIIKHSFGGGTSMSIMMAASDKNINNVEGQKVQRVGLSLDMRTLELKLGSGWADGVTREVNKDDPKEKYNAMARVKIAFRRPAANEKDVLAAIERFAQNYRKALVENVDTLTHQDLVNYRELLQIK